MSYIIKPRRGLKKDLPVLAEHEIAFTTDTKEIYVGSSSGNQLIGGGGDIELKTIGGTSIKGSGDIPFKTVGNQTITGSGNIEIPVVPTFKTVNEQSIIGTGNIEIKEQDSQNTFQGKVISILGDSISTLQGYIPVEDGWNLPHQHAYASNFGIKNTWWGQVIDNLGAKLGINDSWDGTRVVNTSAEDNVSAKVGPNVYIGSSTRLINLNSNGTPDLILVYAGTNDGRNGNLTKDFDPSVTYTNMQPEDVYNNAPSSDFSDAYVALIRKLQHLYPKSKIVALGIFQSMSYALNSVKVHRTNKIIKDVCEYFGVPYIDLRKMGTTYENYYSFTKDGLHPNEVGMRAISNYVTKEILNTLTVAEGENVVYQVTHTLTNLTTSKPQVKGVSSGTAYTETLTGDNLGSAVVFVNGVNVTNNVYDTSTGVISISNVNGPIIITESSEIVNVSGVSLDQNTTEVNVGDNVTLTATINPSNATSKAVNWSIVSGNSNISITPNGLSCTITGVSSGSAKVRVTTVDGSFTADCDITITNINVPVTNVTLNKYNENINVNAETTLTATILPSNASNKGVTWSIESGNSNVSITPNGLNCVVKGLAEGSAVVKATTADGAKIAQCSFTIIVPIPVQETWYVDFTHAGGNFNYKSNFPGFGFQEATTVSSMQGVPINAIKVLPSEAGTLAIYKVIDNVSETDPLFTLTIPEGDAISTAPADGSLAKVYKFPQTITLANNERLRVRAVAPSGGIWVSTSVKPAGSLVTVYPPGVEAKDENWCGSIGYGIVE